MAVNHPSMSSFTIVGTVHLFMGATAWDLSGLPFSQALNMQDESMARWRASPFQL